MSGTQAAICVDGSLDLYYANSYSTPSIVPNYLKNIQCVRSNNNITLSFQRKFQESDSTVDLSKAFYFVGAYDTVKSPVFTKHTHKEAKYVGVNGISSPTSSPTSNPTNSPNFGLKEYTASIETMEKVSCQAKWYDEPNPLVSFEVVCSSPNWCGLGMNSKTASMSEMEAVICVNQDVQLYQTDSGYIPPYNDGLNQYLSSVNCMQNSTTTVMKFSRRFSISSESSNSNTVDFATDSFVVFLSAYGYGPTLEYMHAEKSYTFFKFSLSETPSPTIAEPEKTKSPTIAFSPSPTTQVGQGSVITENSESGSKTAVIAVMASIIAIISASLIIMWLRKKKSTNHLKLTRTTDIAENRLSALSPGTGDCGNKDAIAL